jgi:acetyltransferase
MKRLEKLFNPNSIAVIGASNDKSSVGFAIFKNLIGLNYKGIAYPVNIKRKSIQGVKAYSSITKIDDKVDLAIICTPSPTVLSLVEECGRADVKSIIIVSSGFQEAGAGGEKNSQEILKIARKYNMRILGPNCLGFNRPKHSLNATFSRTMTEPGNIAFISQSGALGTAMLDWAIDKNIRFGYFVSVGSMLDIGFHDLIEYFGNDPDISSILIYMESLTDARKFLSTARAHSVKKPIVVLKAGRSESGARAAKSHTGALAGNDDIYDAAFKRAGIIRVDATRDLFNIAQALSMQPRPNGNKLAIITNAGGPGVIATDVLAKLSGNLAEIKKETIAELDKFLPVNWSRSNPVDVLGEADADRYRKVLEKCLIDSNIDGILLVLTPQAMTDAASIAKEVVNISKESRKTILASWMGSREVMAGMKVLENGGIPNFKTPEDAVRTFMNMFNYSKNLELLYETPATIPHAFKPQTEKNKVLLDKVLAEKRMSLTEAESKELLSNYEIPVTKNAIAQSAEEASRIAEKIGFPIAAKISSPDIFHKIDVGGVILGLENKEDVRKAYVKITNSVKNKMPKARIHGVFIEGMVKKKYEILIGCKKDSVFGPAIVFGMGGVAVEIFKDTNIGLPPLNMALAMRMIEDTKVYRLLKGYRGMPGVDIASIQFVLYKFAYLVADFPIIKEIDINPFAVDEKGGMVLDAKVFLDEKIVGRDIKPYAHLSITPYPKEFIKEFKMKNGTKALFRPIRPEDEQLESELITTFSEETKKNRFLNFKEITHEVLSRFTHIDYDREIAVVAEIEEKGKKKFAGVVRMTIDSFDNSAELTIAIGDPWQGKGLGSQLFDYILTVATLKKADKVWIKFFRSNGRMLQIVNRRGFRIGGAGNIMKAELDLEKK